MQDAAEAPHPVDGSQGLQLTGEISMLRPAGGDCSHHSLVHSGHEPRFAFDVGFGNVGFHMQRPVYAERHRLGEVAFCVPLAVEPAAEPGVGEPILVDEVEVGIENAQGRPISSSLKSPAARNWVHRCLDPSTTQDTPPVWPTAGARTMDSQWSLLSMG